MSQPKKRKLAEDDHASSSTQSVEMLLSMNLYHDQKIEQILTNAVKMAFRHGNNLCPTHWSSLDMLHYEGYQGLEKMAKASKLQNGSKVVDIGAGVGGPARFLVHRYNCSVTAVEFVPALARAGGVLNRLMSIPQDKMNFVCGDVVEVDLKQHGLLATVDTVVSQLAILHIPDKKGVFSQIAKCLKPGGFFFLEDYFLLTDAFTTEEKGVLTYDISVPDGVLQTKEEYIKTIKDAGLEVQLWEDKTDDWSVFIWSRLESFIENMDAMKGIHGEQYAAEMHHFYKETAFMFGATKSIQQRIHNPSSVSNPSSQAPAKLLSSSEQQQSKCKACAEYAPLPLRDSYPKAVESVGPARIGANRVQNLGGARIVGYKPL